MAGFIFGGETQITPEMLKRRRAIAAQLMKSSGRPRYAVEGLGQAAEKIAGALLGRKLDKQEAKAREMGIPGFRYGTNFAPGGMALVGEDGPEILNIPRGAQVIPNPQTVYDDMNGPAARMAPYIQPPASANQMQAPEPSDYLREELGDELFRQYEQMTPMQRQQFINDPANGFVSPSMDDANNRFDDARAYQTADIAGIDANRIAQPPAMGADSVQKRRLGDDEIAYRDAMNGLSGILEELQGNPELLDSAHTWTGRGATGLLRLRDRSGIEAFDLSPEEEKKLGDTTAYKQELLTRVNQYIKDITGAQVGQGDETRRLMAVQANEGDSPTQVIAKITNALDLARLDIARRVYMQREGGEAPTDKELRDILKNRGKELYETAISQGMSPNDARMQAAAALSQEFGL